MEERVPAEDVAARADRRASLLFLPVALDFRIPDDVATVEAGIEVQRYVARRFTFQIYREPKWNTIFDNRRLRLRILDDVNRKAHLWALNVSWMLGFDVNWKLQGVSRILGNER